MTQAGGIAVLVGATLLAACSKPIGKGWDWNRMRLQPRDEPYGQNAFFSNGQSMRTPPPGTIARESASLAGPVSGVAPARLVAVTPALLERGATRFHIFCAVCHGERGDGNSIVASNMDPPKPGSLLTPAVRALSPEQLYTIVTDGFGHMPPYAASLTPIGRWAVVAYVTHLQGRASLVSAPSDSALAVDRGTQ